MHRLIITVMGITIALSSFLPAQAAEGVTVTIDSIVSDDHISGTVTGLTESGLAEYKVVVYIKTDKWYIHPFERGGDGKSFASIGSKGKWSIQTVRREFEASTIAALVVKRDATVSAETENVRAIPNEAVMVRELEGTPDHGKL